MIAPMSLAIETQSLTKRFSREAGWRSAFSRQLDRPAVDAVDLQVQQGELFGLVGPNGAGKTTLVKLLSTLIVPTSGRANVSGYDLSQELAIKRAVGLVTSDERSFYWRLSGQQNLAFFAALHGLDWPAAEARSAEVLEQVGLGDQGTKPFQKYSTGMKQRLSIARALLVRPQILFLDEPTKGLDPAATRQLQTVVGRDAGSVLVVLQTNHIPGVSEVVKRFVGFQHTVADQGQQRTQDDCDAARLIGESHWRQLLWHELNCTILSLRTDVSKLELWQCRKFE